MANGKLTKYEADALTRKELLKDFLLKPTNENLVAVDTALLLASALRIPEHEALAILTTLGDVLEELLISGKQFAIPGKLRISLDAVHKKRIKTYYNRKFHQDVKGFYSLPARYMLKRRTTAQKISRSKKKVLSYLFGFWEAQQGMTDSIPMSLYYPKLRMRFHILNRLVDPGSRKFRARQRKIEERGEQALLEYKERRDNEKEEVNGFD